MRMSERVGWSVWLCKQGSACACMCVCVCACMYVCMWLEDSVALVRMWILHLQALLLLLCFHGGIVTYCCTEDSA